MILVAIGTVIILLAAYDIFATLFNPRQRVTPSFRGARFLWRGLAPKIVGRSHLLGTTGPLLLLSVIGYWTTSMVAGWALIYWPFLPDQGFQIASNLDPGDQDGIIDAIYFSFITLTTLGFGDISPTGDVFRILVPVESAIGFVLLSAGISWILSIYPTLSHRQELAHLIVMTWNQAGAEGLSGLGLDDGEITTFYHEITTKLLIVRNDLLQFPITYYFYSGDELSSLPRAAQYLPSLIEADTIGTTAPGAQFHIQQASSALDSLASTVADDFLIRLDSDTPTAEILYAYAAEWGQSQ